MRWHRVCSVCNGQIFKGEGEIIGRCSTDGTQFWRHKKCARTTEIWMGVFPCPWLTGDFLEYNGERYRIKNIKESFISGFTATLELVENERKSAK
jgi:ribosomal protein L24E